jgi:hypothetical protein
MRLLLGLASCLTLALVPAAAATAQSGGSDEVHVDPGSPAGKEYQIPVDTGRHAGSGGSSSSSSSSGGSGSSGGSSGGSSSSSGSGSAAAGTRFGAGIVPAASSSSSGSSSSDSQDDSSTGSGSKKPSSGTGSIPGATLRATDAQVEEANEAGSATGTALTIGAVGAVVLLGGVAGVLLRRRTTGD